LEKEHHKSLSHVWFMMVKRVEHAGGELYACEVCGLVYRDFEHALACEEFCRSNPAAAADQRPRGPSGGFSQTGASSSSAEHEKDTWKRLDIAPLT